MVAVVLSNGLGLNTSSEAALGAGGVFGRAQLGRQGDRMLVNAATGNLIIQGQDELLMGRGVSMAGLRTYNSLGQVGVDHWQPGALRRVKIDYGTPGTEGSAVTRQDGDGSTQLYYWSTARGMYLSSDGEGAHDTLSWNSGAQSWQWTEGTSQRSETYDAQGRLRSVKDSARQGLTLSYDGYERLAVAQMATGERFEYVYNDRGLLSELRTLTRDQAGGAVSRSQTRVRYDYDEQRRLVRVQVDLSPEDGRVADGGVFETRYTYVGNSALIETVTQGDGSSVRIGYKDGRVESVTDALGGKTRFEYDAARLLTRVYDEREKATTYHYDTEGRLAQLDVPGVNGGVGSTTYQYNSHGDVVEIVDALQRRVSMEVDAWGCVTRQEGGGLIVRRTYNAAHQLIAETLPGAAEPAADAPTTRWVYDDATGTQLRFMISAEGRVTEHRYDPQGQRTATLQYAGALFAVDGLTRDGVPSEATLQTWASAQDRTRLQRSDFRYDWRGQLQSLTQYASVDALGEGVRDGQQSVTQYVYDPSGRLLKQIDPRLGVTQYSYDGLGRLLRTNNAAQQLSTITYEDAHQRVVASAHNGLVSTSTYDRRGDLLSTVQSAGEQTLARHLESRDAAGRLRMTQDTDGARRWQLWDDAGRPVGEVDALGRLVEVVYNASGQEVCRIAYAQPVDLGLLLRADGSPTDVALASLRPSARTGDVRSWMLYDANGRLAKRIDPCGQGQGALTEYSYDSAGRLWLTRRYAQPVTVSALANSPTLSSVTAQPGSADALERRFYDRDGLLLGTADGAGGLIEQQYDAAGRLRATLQHRASTALARLTQSSATLAEVRPQSDRDGAPVLNFYNARGQRVAQLSADGAFSETLYDANGLVERTLRYALRVPAELAASPLEALRSAAGTVQAETRYEYDVLNRVLKEVTDPVGLKLTTTHVYQDAERKLVSTAPNGTVTVTESDELGRVRCVTVDPAGLRLSTTYRYDSQGRLDTVTAPGGGVTTYGYDALGRKISEALSGADGQRAAAHSYAYDAHGRLVRSTNALGKHTLYAYDDAGRLRFTLDAEQGLSERSYDALGRLLSTRQYAQRQNVFQTTAAADGTLSHAVSTPTPDPAHDSVLRYAYDAAGRLRFEMDVNGQVTEMRYDASGLVIGKRVYAKPLRPASFNTAQTPLAHWSVSDPGSTGGTIARVFDAERAENVISVKGDGTFTAYKLNADGNGGSWNAQGSLLSWDMKYGEKFAAYAVLKTSAGNQVLKYTQGTFAPNIKGGYLCLSVGTIADGQWHRLSRDLQADLRACLPDAQLLSVDGFYIRGSGLVGDVRLDPIADVPTAEYIAQALQADAADSYTSYYYDTAGRLRYQVDALGNTQETRYDAVGQVTAQVAYALPAAPAGYNTERTDLRYWSVYDAGGTGGTIKRVYDSVRQEAVVALSGNGTATGYRLSRDAAGSDWRAQGRSLAWDMRFSENFTAYATVKTSAGDKTLQYNQGTAAPRVEGNTVFLQLGSIADGQWRRISRDLQADLQTCLPGVQVLTVESFQIRGNGRIGDVVLNPPVGARSADWMAGLLRPDAADRVTRFAYDAAGRQTFAVDAAGGVTQYAYDAAGRVVSERRHAAALSQPGQGSDDGRTLMLAGAKGELRSTQFAAIDPNRSYTLRARVRQYAGSAPLYVGLVPRNAQGQVLTNQGAYLYAAAQTLSPGQGWVRFEGKFKGVAADAASWKQGQFVAGTKDVAALLLFNYAAEGTGVNAQSRVEVDQLELVDDATGSIVSGSKMAEGAQGWQLVSGQWAAADDATLTDAQLRARCEESAKDAVLRREYDAAGRLIAQLDATGSGIRYRYDASGQLVEQRELASRLGGLDAQRTLVAQLDALANGRADRITRQVWDAAGRLAHRVDATGQLTSYRYDDAGRLLSERVRAQALDLPAQGSEDGRTLLLAGSQGQVRSTRFAAIDPNRSYKLRARVRQLSGQGKIYLGVVPRNPQGLAFTNNGAYLYTAATELRAEQGWQTFEASLKGIAADAASWQPGQFLAGTADATALLLYNYAAQDSADAPVEIDALELIDEHTGERVSGGRADEARPEDAWTLVQGRYTSWEQFASAVALDSLAPLTADRVTRYAYDAAGRKTHAVDATGAATQFEYDAAGRVLSQRQYASRVGANRVDLPYAADARVQAVPSENAGLSAGQTLYKATDRDGLVGSWFEVAAGDRIALSVDVLHEAGTPSSPFGIGLYYSRDGVSYERFERLAEQMRGDQTGTLQGTLTVPEGYRYARVMVQLEGSWGQTGARYFRAVQAYRHDAAGTPIARTDNAALGLGELLQRQLSPSNADRLSRHIYDASGQLRYRVDAEGFVSEQRFDAQGRVTQTLRYTAAPSAAVLEKLALTLDASLLGGAITTSERQYDAAGRLARELDGERVECRYAYDTAGRLILKTDAAGLPEERRTRYGYDAAGRLARKTEAEGSPIARSWVYEYDALGQLVTEFDPRAQQLTEQDDSTARQLRQRLGYGAELGKLDAATLQTLRLRYASRHTYDAAGRRLSSTDALGGISTTRYDALGRAVAQVDARGGTRYWAYDATGRVVQEVDAERHLTLHRYDTLGNRIETVQVNARVQGSLRDGEAVRLGVGGDAGGGAWVALDAARDAQSSRGYDALGRMLSDTDAERHTERVEYNAFGDRTAMVNRLGARATLRYDRRGLVLAETLPVQAPDAQGQLRDVTHRYEYDALGLRTRSIEAEGLTEQRITEMRYNRRGQLLQRIGAAFTTVDGTLCTPVDSFAYDALGRVIEQRAHAQWVNGQAVGGRRSLAYYNALDQKTAELSADGVLGRYAYDAAGNTVRQTVHATRIALPASAGGAIPAVVEHFDDRSLQTDYDALNRKIAVRIERLYTWEEGQRVDQLQAATVTLEQLRYDAVGHLIERVDGRGNSSHDYYDALGRRVLSVDALGAVTAWDYERGAIATATRETRYAALLGGRIDAQTSLADAAALRQRVAAQARPDKTADRVTLFQLDALGRVLEKRVKDVTQDLVDAQGTRTQSSADAVTTYAYNGLGAVTRMRELAAVTLDVQGQRQERWEQTDTAHDGLGREILRSAPERSDATGARVRPRVQTHYDGLGQVRIQRQLGSDDASSADDRVTRYEYKAGLLVAEQDAADALTTYAYDALGQLVRRTAVGVHQDASTTRDIVKTYGYDAAGRLSSETDRDTGEVRDTRYNAFGEIEAKGMNGRWYERAEYSALGKVIKTNAGDGATKFYLQDANGNTTREIRASGFIQTDPATLTLAQAATHTLLYSHRYVYDARNQLVKTIDPEIQQLASSSTMVSQYGERWVPAWQPMNAQCGGGGYYDAAEVSLLPSSTAGKPGQIAFNGSEVNYLNIDIYPSNPPNDMPAGGGIWGAQLSRQDLSKPFVLDTTMTFGRTEDAPPGVNVLKPGNQYVIFYKAWKGGWEQGQVKYSGRVLINVDSNGTVTSITPMERGRHDFKVPPYIKLNASNAVDYQVSITSTTRGQVFSGRSRGTSLYLTSIAPGSGSDLFDLDFTGYDSYDYSGNVTSKGRVTFRLWADGSIVIYNTSSETNAYTVPFFVKGRQVPRGTLTLKGSGTTISTWGSWTPANGDDAGYTAFHFNAHEFATYAGDYDFTLALQDDSGKPLLDEAGVQLVQAGRIRFSSNGSSPPKVLERVITLESKPGVTVTRSQSYNAFGEIAEEADDRVLERMTAMLRMVSGDALAAPTEAQKAAVRNQFYYNALGKLVEKVEPETYRTERNGYRWRARPVTSYGYDLLGRHTTTKDAAGNLTRLSYAEGARGDASAAEYTFDAAGGSAQAYDGHAGGITRVQRNVFGDVTRITDGEGQVTEQQRDALGRLLSTRQLNVLRLRFNGSSATQERRDITVSYTYDELGQRLSSTDALGNTSTTRYDSLGRVVATTSAQGFVTRYSYEALTPTLPASANPTLLSTVAALRKTTTTADGHTLKDETDHFGHLLAHTDMSGALTSYTYSQGAQIVSKKGSNGALFNVQYDYYANGYLRTVTDFGTRIQHIYTYDNAGNRVTEGYHTYTGDTPVLSIANYAPPAGGGGGGGAATAPSTTQAGGTPGQDALIVYDELNRIVRVQDKNFFTVDYEFDANGNRRRIHATYKDGAAGLRSDAEQDYWYDYDALNRFVITKGKLSGARAASVNDASTSVLSYDPFGVEPDSPGYKEGHVIGYDRAGRRTYDSYRVGNTLHHESYAYSGDGFLMRAQVSKLERSFVSSTKVHSLDPSVSYTESPSGRWYYTDRSMATRTIALRDLDDLGRTVNAYDLHTVGTTRTTSTTYDKDSRVLTQSYTDASDSKRNYSLSNRYHAGSYALADASGSGAGALAQSVITPADTPSKATVTEYQYLLADEARQQTVTKYTRTTYTSSGPMSPTPSTDPDAAPSTDATRSETITDVGTTTFAYDANGHIRRTEDSVAKLTQTYVTDANGQVLRRERVQYDPNAHAYKTSVHDFFYADGHRVGDLSNTPEDKLRVSYAEQLARDDAARSALPRDTLYKAPLPAARVDFDSNFEPINDRYPGAAPMLYTVHSDAESLAAIAQNLWGDSAMWFLIAQANGLDANAVLKAGQVLVIPNKLTNIHNNAHTWRPYNPAEALGSVDPTQPLPPPPPQKGCGTLGTLIMVAVAVAVTVATQGAATKFFASLGSFAPVAGGATAAAAGSIASQAAGLAIGQIDSFSWRSVGQAALGGGISGGIAAMSGADGVLSALGRDSWQAAAGRAALGSAATMALRGDWNWREVMISTVGAGLGSAIGSYLGNPSSLGTKLVAGLASGVAVTALMGGNRRNYESVFANTLGSALGESIVETVRDSSLPDNVRGMSKDVRDAAHNLIAKSRMDMNSSSDRSDLSDWARMYGQGEILSVDRREEMGVNHLRRMNLSDDQISDIRNRWADEGLIRAPEQAGQTLTISLDDDQAVKRLPTQYLSGRRANTALGLQELDGMATGAGSLVRRTSELIQGNDYLKYSIEGLSFVAAPLGYLANAAIARSPVGQAIEAKLGEVHESISNRFADVGWGVQDSVDGGTGVMTVGAMTVGFTATKAMAMLGAVVPRSVAQINENAAAGRARELRVQNRLEGAFPDARVQRESYLRNADGTRALDPLSGEARRIDHVVIENEKVRHLVETTSPNANKMEQILKEQSIRSQGPVYIRDRVTGKLIEVSDVATRIIRVK